MAAKDGTKINNLLSLIPSGVVLLSSWLSSQGYSPSLQQHYKKSGWLESMGTGALRRKGEKVDYLSGLYALQKQLGLSVHVAGRTALSLLGRAHYLDLGAGRAVLMGAPKEILPLWFEKRDWGTTIGADFIKIGLKISYA